MDVPSAAGCAVIRQKDRACAASRNRPHSPRSIVLYGQGACGHVVEHKRHPGCQGGGIRHRVGLSPGSNKRVDIA